tara:strand:- start:406 stop:810 length:405 start_codon:yes stop_codon:yes gene_type:complete
MPIHNLEMKLIGADLELKERTNVTYEDLVDEVNIESEKKETEYMENMWDDNLANEFITQQFYYSDNFTLKELHHIANYYDISKRKKRKNELIDDIIAFELDTENTEIVETRKRLWFYLNEIKNDKYLSKFIILE